MIVEFLETGKTRKELLESYESSTATVINWKKIYGTFGKSSSIEIAMKAYEKSQKNKIWNRYKTEEKDSSRKEGNVIFLFSG